MPPKRKRDDEKLRVGIVGATGMVGQRFIALLENHPLFNVTVLAASANSSGKVYSNLMEGKWVMPKAMPKEVSEMKVMDASKIDEVTAQCDFVFCAVDMDKKEVLKLEEAYAKSETPVVSNNSAARGLNDVPMIIPEVNFEHTSVIAAQRKRLGTKHGFIAVKPNCSIQSYVPPLHPLKEFGLKQISVTTFQAISGAGKTFTSWPEMVDNVIPFIGGEEPKSENEPLKIWGAIKDGKVEDAKSPVISAQCIRVACTDGHLAAVSVKFDKKPTIEEIKKRWSNWTTEANKLSLPSAPSPFLHYFEEENRPQTKLDRDAGNGMAVTIGRLREDKIFDYKFVCLSHNTVRGAAGGAVLVAELLAKQGYLPSKANR